MNAVKPERKGERTRRKLLDGAKVVFSQNGYLNADVAAIARAAGKSTGAFYLYFENKADLLDALIDDFSATAQQMGATRADDFYEKLDFSVVRTVLRDVWHMSKEHSATLYALAQASMVDPYFVARSRAIRAPALLDLRRMIEARQAHGHCRGLDAEAGSIFLEALLNHSLLEIHSLGPSPFPSKAAENRAFSSFVEIFARVLALERPIRKRSLPRRTPRLGDGQP